MFHSLTPGLIITAHADAADLALGELRAVAPNMHLRTSLDDEVMLIDTQVEFDALAAQWQANPPIFVRHMCPAYAVAPLAGTPADVETITHAFQPLMSLVAPDLAFSVQTRILAERLPYKVYDISQALSTAIHETSQAPLDVRFPAQVVSLVIGPHKAPPLYAYLGVSETSQNLSDWAGGERRFKREGDLISRSEFKLLEAFEVFNIDLSPRGQALDLGAAPGGWTRILRGLDQYVTAIDPGELDPRLSKDKGIRYRRMNAETYLDDDPDAFDVIVNDMRMDARDSSRLMVKYARLLHPHGRALMTLKLPEQGRREIIDVAFEILRYAYEILGARQLFHNRSEITVYLKRSR